MLTFHDALFMQKFSTTVACDGGKTLSKDGKDGKDDALPSGIVGASVLHI